jgi:iron complex transport system permease protein
MAFVIVFSLLLVCSILFSLSKGYIAIPIKDIIAVLMDRFQAQHPMAETFRAVILDVRLPRILTCAAVGAALSISGVLFQGILLNPLADPYTLGVSAGAAFGASVAILLNLADTAVSIPGFAFIGACLTLLFVLFLSYSPKHPARGLSSNNLILSGIIVAAILSAGISFLKFIANEQVSVIIFWLMGSFASKTWSNAWTVAGFLCFGYLVSVYYARDLNLITLGDKAAASLGVDLKKVTLILLLTGSPACRNLCLHLRRHRVCRAAGSPYGADDHRS